ncbi:uncharacterized protein SCHCODRAFT_02642944 [Schizophyllum commune H4-8]|uniref:uncharacterized protein n=1 Tax=Schizophyllum commune (strain H4-8 / FGSC 9210) TaxID=578458 RepID=UPI0021601549|nr:uncharacterized protein SCHCODRAFT_02642944 [Schizophyllum commune H4-8]KAI5885979.1 hypothetical protein SCHCODRAFT_02642944 [Schizophyllum commune H4-8]
MQPLSAVSLTTRAPSLAQPPAHPYISMRPQRPSTTASSQGSPTHHHSTVFLAPLEGR